MEGSLSLYFMYYSLSLCYSLFLFALCTVSVEHFLWVLVPFCENIILLQELGMCT